MTACKHLVRAALFLLLLLSPVGAPVVGAFIGHMCPVDDSMVPDGPFAMSTSSCGINHQAEYLYQGAVMFSFMPMVFAGPLMGGLLSLAWWLLGLWAASACIWHLWRALAAVTLEHL